MIAAVVLAAGAATRYGSPKQLVYLPAVLERLAQTTVGEVVVKTAGGSGGAERRANVSTRLDIRGMRAEDAVLAGYDELAHINQVLLNFVSRPGDDNRTLDRFTRVGDDAQFFRPKGAEARRFIDLLNLS